MAFTLTFDTDNDAFQNENDLVEEIPRILRTIATKFEHGRTEGAVMDVNGNSIGRWEYTP